MLPQKLKSDPIVEALFEIRFETSDQPEVVIGRLIDSHLWADFEQRRLPASDIPQPIRQADPNLRFQPVLELRSSDGQRVVKLGSNVLSFHVLRPYCGWSEFLPTLAELVDQVFSRLKGLKTSRLGLRYVNAFVPSKHIIGNIGDLVLTVDVSGNRLTDNVLLNYHVDLGSAYRAMVKIATAQFVQGPLPPDARVLVDVDVVSKPKVAFDNADSVVAWLKDAHTFEKETFFGLIPEATVRQLAES